jgi:protein gp37
MGEKSNIQWTDATWNIARGCTKVDADCKYCYMYRESMDATRYDPLNVVRTKGVFTMPLKFKETHSKVWHGRPLIFTSSLTDFFHEEIDSYRDEAWDIIRSCPHLIFQILTKRPERIKDHLPADWGDGWDNVWLGTSIGSQESIGRMNDMIGFGAKVKFLSLEPLHGPIDLHGAKHNDFFVLPVFDWIIVGGESGNEHGKYKYRPCEIDWFDLIVHQCKLDRIPVFVKQMGTHLAKAMSMSDRHGGDINEFPDHLKVREFPRGAM